MRALLSACAAVKLVRECIEKDIIEKLRNADGSQRTRHAEAAAADLNPALKALIKRVVKECVTLDTSAERQTLEQALCKHNSLCVLSFALSREAHPEH